MAGEEKSDYSDILCSVSPQLMKSISEITQEEFEQPKEAKTSCCAVISIREPLPINSTIISSSKGLQSEKSKGGGLYQAWHLNADTSTSLYKIEFLSEWLSCKREASCCKCR